MRNISEYIFSHFSTRFAPLYYKFCNSFNVACSWQHAQAAFAGEFRDVAPITTNLLTKQINPISGQQQLRLAIIIITTTITMKVASQKEKDNNKSTQELSSLFLLLPETISASARLGQYLKITCFASDPRLRLRVTFSLLDLSTAWMNELISFLKHLLSRSGIRQALTDQESHRIIELLVNQ